MRLTGIRKIYNMKISIRMDDVTPDMDWAKFMRFKALCDLYQVQPLIGVVPDCQDAMLHIDEPEISSAAFWDYLKTLKDEGWTIAQHGVTHVYHTKKMGCFPLNRLSEFAGRSYKQQYESLKEGRKILSAHGIDTDLFMAPAHSFDKNTIKALKKLGFHRMTDGFGDRPYIRWGMVFYPISYRQGSVLKKMDKQGYTTFVVHANTMEDRDFERYEQLFADCRDRLVSYRELVRVEPVGRSVFGHWKEYWMALAKFVLVNLKNSRGKGKNKK